MGYRLRSISIRGYRGVGDTRLDLDFAKPLIVLFGDNGAGKSTVISAVEWALFGKVTGADDARQGEADRKRAYINRNSDAAEVTITLTLESDDREKIAVTRIRKRDCAARDNDAVTVEINGEAVEGEDAAVLLGLTHGMYHRACAPSQSDMQALVADKAEDRDAALERTPGGG